MSRSKSWLIAIGLLLIPSPSLAEEPVVGDLLESGSETPFRTWNRVGSAIGPYNQSYAVFKRGDRFIVASTVPVKRTERGGFEIEKITVVRSIVAPPGTEEVDGYSCQFLGLTPALAFADRGSKIVTAYFAMSDEVVVRKWIYEDKSECEYGGD